MRNCENCGSVFGIHGCTWCNEELYIFDQYVEGGLELPDENSIFMEKVREQRNGLSGNK